MFLNKDTSFDIRGTFTGPSGLEDKVSGKTSPPKFSWTTEGAIELGVAEQNVLLSQIDSHIARILMEADRAFIKISATQPSRTFEIKRLNVPVFDFFIYPYDPEMPAGVQCENLEQYLKLMFSQASSLSIMVREASPSRWEISCVDVEYKQSKRSAPVRKEDGH